MRTSLRLTLPVLALASGILLAPAAHADVVDTCGGAVSDYSGKGGAPVDTPFVGKVFLPEGEERDITIAPLGAGSVLLQTTITTSPNNTRYAVGTLSLHVDNLGRGHVFFPSYGGSGLADEVVCALGTRVTQMSGTVYVDGVGMADFTVGRV